MKKVKQVLKILIFATFAMLSFSFNVSALTEGDWEFQLLDNEVMITKYLGSDTNVKIPETIYGVPVTKTGEHIFDSVSETIKTITFPKTMKVIDEISWNWYDFKGPETIIISEGVTEIKPGAFQRMINLKTVKLPSTLKKIGNQAFSKCKSLRNLEIPQSVEYLGEQVFQECALEYLDISHIDASEAALLFEDCPNLKTVKLNTKMTKIPSCMFLGCSALESIDIPSTVTYIGVRAFAGCKSLKNIILPTSLNKIDAIAFNGSGITELVIPYGTKIIGRLLVDTDNFKSLYVPETVNSFSSEAIKNAPNCIVYCAKGSHTENICRKNNISYLTDSSVNSGITVLYNGTRISFHSYGQNPALINSRTLVPLRSIFEAMGADVEWDGSTRTATAMRDGVTVKIQIGANEIYKNGSAISVDVPAQLLNSRTMVPARVIAEAFGADVKWNSNGKTVLITE